jgi:hypothetical protein
LLFVSFLFTTLQLMGNKKKARFMYHDTPDPSRHDPQRHKHINYAATTNGRLKASTSFVTTAANRLPSDLMAPEQCELTIPDVLYDGDDDEGVLDPAYLDYLVEMSAEENFGHKTRHRTAAVSFQLVRNSVGSVD